MQFQFALVVPLWLLAYNQPQLQKLMKLIVWIYYNHNIAQSSIIYWYSCNDNISSAILYFASLWFLYFLLNLDLLCFYCICSRAFWCQCYVFCILSRSKVQMAHCHFEISRHLLQFSYLNCNTWNHDCSLYIYHQT